MPDLFEHPSFDSHEQVIFISDQASGLRGIIGIHSTVLGPAAGGCRMYPYASTDEAVTDVLRLSQGMTLKNAAAGLPLGGGKCVIIANPSAPGKPELLRAVARHVQRLGGRYWTAIDVGVSAEDADIMADESDYVFATAREFQGDANPSHYTALGGFQGVRAVTAHLRGNDDLRGVRVSVQGAGQTGADLIQQLVDHGADVVAADINSAALEAVVAACGVSTVPPDVIHAQEVDVFAPCAMGGVLNDHTIPELKCRGIAGLANNQLERPEHADLLLARGIAYAPDFVVNSGGVIRATMPIYAETDREAAAHRIANLFPTILGILDQSKASGRTTDEIARRIAAQRINEAREAGS